MQKNRIFVSICAFNEMFILRTIEDALKKAENPEMISFGIFNQKSTDQSFEDFSQYPNVRFVNAHCDIPLGVGLARLNASMLHDKEEYFLQIDAHTLFVKNWDSILISSYLDLLHLGVQKPIIAQSMQWHTIDAYRSDDYQNSITPTTSRPLFIDKRGDTAVITDESILFNCKKLSDRFIEHYGVIAGFMFTSSSFIYEVSYDFRIAYVPDQESMALRAYTRGYRIFSIGITIVSALTKQKITESGQQFDECNFIHDHQMNHIDGKNPKYITLDRHKWKESNLYEFLRGNLFGWFGAPDRNLYDEYIKNSGFDFTDARPMMPRQKEQQPEFWNKSIY